MKSFHQKLLTMNRRKGKLIDLKIRKNKRLIFHALTRGLMGYTSRFLTLTKGTEQLIEFFIPTEIILDMEGRRNRL